MTRSHAYLRTDINRPFPSYPKPLFQSEAMSKAICEFQTLSLSKRGYAQNPSCENKFYVHENKTHFQIHGIALSLTLKRKHLAARKLACVAGGILVSGALSWRRSRHAKRVAKPRGNFKLICIPSLLAAPPPKQYSTPTQVPPAAQATR